MRPLKAVLYSTAIAVSALIFLGGIVALANVDRSVVATGPKVRADPNTGPFEGLGAWIDIFDKTSWKHPRRAVSKMASEGVRTLYLQTGNDSQRRAIVKRKGVGAFLDAAHAKGIQVVAWYLPGFANIETDLGRVEAAIAFRTASGNGFDGFALDIESAEVHDPMLRTARLLQLSDQIRAYAGETFPLGAIIPSPDGLRAHADYWPNFPYQELALRYDTVLPMSYFTWRNKTTTGPGDYVTNDIRILRRAVGSNALPIHVIGGIAQEAELLGVGGFVGAVIKGHVIGESLYSYPGVTAAMWSALARVPIVPASPSASSAASSTSPTP